PGCCRQTVAPAPADTGKYGAPAPLHQTLRILHGSTPTPDATAPGSQRPTGRAFPPGGAPARRQCRSPDDDRDGAPDRAALPADPPASTLPGYRLPATAVTVCRSGLRPAEPQSAPAPAQSPLSHS